MDCVLCGRKTRYLSSMPIENGYLCKHCCSQIPKILQKELRYYNDLRLRGILEYFQTNRERKYEATAHYGDLYIDEANGLFSLREGTKDYIFDVLDLQDISIVSTDVKASSNNVFCNIQLQFSMEYPVMDIRTIIKRNVKCVSKRTDNTHIAYSMPGDLEVIRIIMNNSIDNAEKRYRKAQRVSKNLSKHEIEIIKAKGLFMIEDMYDLEYLNKQKHRLLQIYHPDNKNVDNDIYAKIINKYYKILYDRLEER